MAHKEIAKCIVVKSSFVLPVLMLVHEIHV